MGRYQLGIGGFTSHRHVRTDMVIAMETNCPYNQSMIESCPIVYRQSPSRSSEQDYCCCVGGVALIRRWTSEVGTEAPTHDTMSHDLDHVERSRGKLPRRSGGTKRD